MAQSWSKQQPPCRGPLAKHSWQTYTTANAKSAELEMAAPLHATGSPAGPDVLMSSQYQHEQLFATPETQSLAAAWLF